MFLKNRKKEKQSGGNVNESIKTIDEHEESVGKQVNNIGACFFLLLR